MVINNLLNNINNAMAIADLTIIVVMAIPKAPYFGISKKSNNTSNPNPTADITMLYFTFPMDARILAVGNLNAVSIK